jgi:malonyl CoA-acyl carrier protein transacylase/acyl carrier protein
MIKSQVSNNRRIAFVFPGQGAYYPGVLKQARSSYLCLEPVLAMVEAVGLRRYGRSMLDVIWDESNTLAHLIDKDAVMLQLAIYTASIAAHEILTAEGIEPDVVMGHSFGEIAALVCAGAYSIEHGAEIVCDRIDTLAGAAPQDGCMAAISGAPHDVRALISEWDAGSRQGSAAKPPVVAVENHERQTVVAGPKSVMTDFIAFCAARRISAHLLKSPYAFHHPDLEPVVPLFASRVRAYPTAPLRTIVYSPILRRAYHDSDNLADCLARHLVMPVGFRDAVRALSTDHVSFYFECGALDALSKIITRVVHPETPRTCPIFPGQGAELDALHHTLSVAKETCMMNIAEPIETSAEFEAFWQERSPFMLQQIKNEFARFLARQNAAAAAAPTITEPARDMAQAASPQASATSRAQLFQELVTIYAEAMEYPPEVFNEGVELEAELGIDSVKQTEIVGRISSLYGLPPLPPNFRMGDYKTMGQVTDFVFANLRQVSTAA